VNCAKLFFHKIVQPVAACGKVRTSGMPHKKRSFFIQSTEEVSSGKHACKKPNGLVPHLIGNYTILKAHIIKSWN
jgi:hypothetical protein